ncbi:regulatory factor X 4-like [Lineus longissimus]|uniref:regulatory factor X 4-like n=1 Tax=Lineus longissimus TaxID=88925 RepID=UPI002B4D0C8A
MEKDQWLDDCVQTKSNHTGRDEHGGSTENSAKVTLMTRELGDLISVKMGSKPHSTPLTLKWLEENYEVAEGVCIPRSTLYTHYLEFTEKHDIQPVNAASFGKIIRQPFPQITTRRLGTRGQSKYHYYGIAVKPTSIFYDVMYSKREIQSDGIDGKRDTKHQLLTYSPRMKLGTLLPEFPQLSDIKLPASVSEEKVSTFVMMYRTHCQRVLDTVIRANFDEVQNLLLHFWQGMPQHIVPIMSCREVIIVVGICDSILYKAISNVLMPSVLHALPESLTQVIRKFAKDLENWLQMALNDLPGELRMMKFGLARRFSTLLRRQTSLNHLCQASRSVVLSTELTAQMLEDWSNIDLGSICKQTLYTMDMYREKDHETIVELYSEFQCLLESRAPTESYIDWLNKMVDRCVVRPSTKTSGSLKRRARDFLLRWSCFGTRVIRDMTLHSATSFGSFHLLHLMFDDYVLLCVEGLHTQERTNELVRMISATADSSDHIEALFNSSCFRSPPMMSHSAMVEQVQMKNMEQFEFQPVERDTVITTVSESYVEDESNDSGMDSMSVTGQISSVNDHFAMSFNKHNIQVNAEIASISTDSASNTTASEGNYDGTQEEGFQMDVSPAHAQGISDKSDTGPNGNDNYVKYSSYCNGPPQGQTPQAAEPGSCVYEQYSSNGTQPPYWADQDIVSYNRQQQEIRDWQSNYAQACQTYSESVEKAVSRKSQPYSNCNSASDEYGSYPYAYLSQQGPGPFLSEANIAYNSAYVRRNNFCST